MNHDDDAKTYTGNHYADIIYWFDKITPAGERKFFWYLETIEQVAKHKKEREMESSIIKTLEMLILDKSGDGEELPFAGFAMGINNYTRLKEELSQMQRISEEQGKGMTRLMFKGFPVYYRSGDGIDVLYV